MLMTSSRIKSGSPVSGALGAIIVAAGVPGARGRLVVKVTVAAHGVQGIDLALAVGGLLHVLPKTDAYSARA